LWGLLSRLVVSDVPDFIELLDVRRDFVEGREDVLEVVETRTLVLSIDAGGL
jgi:hypothetical protein